MSEIKTNMQAVYENIEKAMARAGRSDSVTLIAVTKTHGVDTIKEAYDAGCVQMGENRVQEMMEKIPHLPGVTWHLIGHLQKNKAKYAVGNAQLIHSVDSFELACEINRIAQKKNIVQDILLEVNISGEITKYGLTTEEIKDIIIKIRELCSVRVRGFMTMAPKCDNPESVRGIFRKAKELFDLYRQDNDDIDTLSMGMSNDYIVAVEEGATMVRVGSSIFGKRM